MADFYQDRVPTFTFLNEMALQEIEKELRSVSVPKMGVVIPALFSDLMSDAMANIIKELKEADFVDRIYFHFSIDNITTPWVQFELLFWFVVLVFDFPYNFFQ